MYDVDIFTCDIIRLFIFRASKFGKISNKNLPILSIIIFLPWAMSIIVLSEWAIIYTSIVSTIDRIDEMNVEKNSITAKRRSNFRYMKTIAAGTR
jgi:uncharacterized membrane protein YkvI